MTFYNKISDKEFADVVEYIPNEPKVVFDLDTSTNPLHSDYQVLLDKFNIKLPNDDMQEFLETNDIIQVCGAELDKLFFEIFLKKTSTSLTHLNTLLARYRNLLSAMGKKSEASQCNIMECLFKFWQNSGYHQRVITENLIRENIVEPINVVNWLIQSL